MMKTKIQTIQLLFLGMFFISGCSTIIEHKTTMPGENATGIYRGTRDDANCIYLFFLESDQSVRFLSEGGWFFSLYALIDLPFSVVADTACLPYDLTTLGYTSQRISYEDLTGYRTVKTDRHGKRHGKCPFQLLVYDSNGQNIQGYEHYRHGTLHGKAEAWDIPPDNQRITGEYCDGVPWNGSFLMHAGDTNYLQLNSIDHYDHGVLIGSTPIIIKLKE